MVNRSIGLEQMDGAAIGRDPRHMTQDELRSLGHEPLPPLKAIRQRCLDCCVYQPSEVRKCVSVTCASWPFRMGTNPWRQPASEAQREHARELARQAKNRLPIKGKFAESDEPATLVAAHEDANE